MQKPQHKDEHTIALPSLKETRFVKTVNIIRCESSNSYTSFFLVTGEKIVVSRPIIECEEMLPGYNFIRCHQSHLVNKRYIASWVKNDGDHLLLDDKTVIPISRNRKDFVKEKLQ